MSTSLRYTIGAGEHLPAIAERYGFADWRTIYDHADNAPLRQKRANPHLLAAGDVVVIPAVGEKKLSAATGAEHTFRATKLRTIMLKLDLKDASGNALANTAYELRAGGAVRQGRTDGQGGLREPMPRHLRDVELIIAGRHLRIAVGALAPLDDTDDDGLVGIQGRLHNLGFDVGPATGNLDDRTRAAIRAYQRQHGLSEDGQASAALKQKLVEHSQC